MFSVGFINDDVLVSIGGGTYQEEMDEYIIRLSEPDVIRLIKLLQATLGEKHESE